jgi:hypothetical protein
LSHADKDALIGALSAPLHGLAERVKAPQAENAALRQRLNLPAKTPQNSSTPPSHGHKANSEPGGRRKGQAHPGAACALHPLQAVIEKVRQHLFVFVANRELPASNNGSEQALRPCVTFRKVTNRFRCRWGADLYADIGSVIETARRRAVGALEAIRLTLQNLPLPLGQPVPFLTG